MRLRIVAIAAAAALTYCAIQHRAELPALPDSTALLMNLRNQDAPFRLRPRHRIRKRPFATLRLRSRFTSWTRPDIPPTA